MSNLSAQPVEIQFTVEVTRADTGKTETYVLTGTMEPENTQIPEENLYGCNTLNSIS